MSNSSVQLSGDAKANAHCYVAICVAMVGAMMFGLDQGNFGNVQGFESFQREWCLNRYGDEKTCFGNAAKNNRDWSNGFVMLGATLITFGAAAGALLLGPILTKRCGRRPCISVGGGITFAGCLLASYLAFSSKVVFWIGRFVTGFGVGVSCFALPVYNTEISTASIRGATGSLFQLNVVVGGFLACIFTLKIDDWKLGMVLPGLAGLVLMIASPFIPESPRYVMEARGFDAGVVELQRVRAGDVSGEANGMQTEIETMRATPAVTYWDMAMKPNLRKRVIIACVLVLAQQTTGVNAFLGYAATLFQDCGITNPLLFNTIFNSVMIAGCIAGLLLVDSKYGGRWRQLLVACIFMGPPLIVAGIFLGLPEEQQPKSLIMACLITYGVGFQFAWGTIPWIYPAEIFNLSEKEKSVSLAVGLNYLANAVVIMITPFMMSSSIRCTLLGYGGLNILNFFFVFCFIKETKGVALDRIPALFGDAPARLLTP